MPASAQLFMPRAALSGCLFAAIARDTRALSLGDAERFNHFPASPLVAMTLVFHGETRLVAQNATLEQVKAAAPLPRISITPPQDRPLTSWTPGPVCALTLGFYPDAWQRLTGIPPRDVTPEQLPELPQPLTTVLDSLFDTRPGLPGAWQALQSALGSLWHTSPSPALPPSPRLTDWTRALLARAALSSAGRSLRATERRLRRWSGQSRQSLAFFANMENLHALSVRNRDEPLAQTALDAGYADQSHMGRAVRRATGFSPARLNRMIASEEPFWCYRLMGERF